MARALNYDKNTNYRYTSASSQADFIITKSHYYYKPTTQLIKFNKYLVDLCNEHGIEAQYADPTLDRSIMISINHSLCNKLNAIGVRYSEKWNEQHNRYKFDKDGNVIDRTTGKIVKKRTD